MIVTSVVPPELPMELSLAVNHSLLALHRVGICSFNPNPNPNPDPNPKPNQVDDAAVAALTKHYTTAFRAWEKPVRLPSSSKYQLPS